MHGDYQWLYSIVYCMLGKVHSFDLKLGRPLVMVMNYIEAPPIILFAKAQFLTIHPHREGFSCYDEATVSDEVQIYSNMLDQLKSGKRPNSNAPVRYSTRVTHIATDIHTHHDKPSFRLAFPHILIELHHGAHQGDVCAMQERKALSVSHICDCWISNGRRNCRHTAGHGSWRCWSEPMPDYSTRLLSVP